MFLFGTKSRKDRLIIHIQAVNLTEIIMINCKCAICAKNMLTTLLYQIEILYIKNAHFAQTAKKGEKMQKLSLYIDEVLRFYNKKLLKLKKEVQKTEEAIKIFEEMKRGEKENGRL